MNDRASSPLGKPRRSALAMLEHVADIVACLTEILALIVVSGLVIGLMIALARS